MKISIIGGGPAGLYFGILMKKAAPSCDITIFEKNPPDVTWGWGVVFSDETIGGFQEADPESYEQITKNFARWDSIDIHFRGEVIRSGGHVFCGIRRMKLLQILQKRCADLNVRLEFGREMNDLAVLEDSDLI